MVTFLVLSNGILLSQWSTDPWINTAINADDYMQAYPDACTDMRGGVIVVWREKNTDLYALRLDKYGYMKWNPDGVPICTAEQWQWTIDIVSDEKGGAIILWKDYRQLNQEWDLEYASNTLYVQRIDSQGRVLWEKNGVQLSDFRTYTYIDASDSLQQIQRIPTHSEKIAPDGHGGAYICWTATHDSIDDQTFNQIAYIQHVDCSGNCLWDEYGKPVMVGIQEICSIISDDSSGIYCLIDWKYIYRFNYNGNMMWDNPISTLLGIDADMVTDDMGGFFAAGTRKYYPGKILMYRADRSGNKLLDNWTYDIETGIETISPRMRIYPDGHNGIYLIFKDYDDVIHMLRVGPDGNIIWEKHGKDIDTPNLIDGYGNWFRLYGKNDSTYRVYARKYDKDGNSLWGDDGILVRIRNEDWGGFGFWKFVSDLNGGLIMVWDETRHLTQYWDIMGQMVNSDGQLGIAINTINPKIPPPIIFNLVKCYPNPFNLSTNIIYQIAEPGYVNISIFDINGKTVFEDKFYQNQPGTHEYIWFGQNVNNCSLSSGIYFVRLLNNAESHSEKMLLLK